MRYLCCHLGVQLYSLTACFKPRRALLFASEINITSEAFEAILEQNRGVLRVPDSCDEIVISKRPWRGM